MSTMSTSRRSTLPNRRSPQRKRRTITIEEFDRDMSKAIAAARKPGGVDVVDSTGKLRFYMVIPRGTLPEIL
jgi:hypothetical protein